MPFFFVRPKQYGCRSSQGFTKNQIKTQRKRLWFGEEEQQNERAPIFAKKSEQAI